MPTVDFLEFATAVDADVMTQADYLAAGFRPSGFQNGIAIAEQLNKVWRQSSFVAAALARYMSTQTGSDVLDDGDIAAFVTILSNAIVLGAGNRPARTVTASANLNILLTDYRVGFARVAAPAALDAQLLASPVGKSYKIGDLQGNAFAFPIRVLPPAGHSIAQAASFTLNVDKGWAEFAYMGSSTWSVEQ